MVAPNSIPEHTLGNPMNDHGGTSSIKEESDTRDDTLSRQSNHGAVPVTDDRLGSLSDQPKKQPTLFPRRSLDPGSSSSNVTTVAPVDALLIDPKMYGALVKGVKELVLRPGVNLCEFRCEKDSNSALHIAACAGHDLLIHDVVINFKDIVMLKNSDGDLAFHCAAKSAQLVALEALTNWEKYPEESGISSAMLLEKDGKGDTALHIALGNDQKEMAEYLVEKCPEACFARNEENVSPLYMAIKLRYEDLAIKMVNDTYSKPGSNYALMWSKSVVHAAIESEMIGVLEEILEHHENLIDLLDDEGQTPLSYAAFQGYLPVVEYLLEKFPDYAYKCNSDSSFPIHKAASGGHVKVIKKLYTSRQLLNGNGQNILHIAAENGKAKVVSFILKETDLKRLVNVKDKDGSTPLHLAAKGFNPLVVYILSRESRAKQEYNRDGLTALDLVEIHAGSPSTFDSRLSWMALRYVNAPRSSQSTRQTCFDKLESDCSNTINKEENGDKTELEKFNHGNNTILLVATLVATVTFAAGFTAPGGYKQDEPNIGMAVLADKLAFQIYVICNTAALYSSILSVVSLIWAYIGDVKLMKFSLKVALPLLGFALTMMSLAFMMGIFVVSRTLPWLSYVVLGMGSVFLPAVLLVFIPLYNPSYIKNPVVRFFFSGPLLLLIFVNEKGRIKYD